MLKTLEIWILVLKLNGNSRFKFSILLHFIILLRSEKKITSEDAVMLSE